MYCDVELQYSYSLVIQCSKNRIDLTVVWKSEGDMGMKDIITTSHSQISMQLAMKNHAQMVPGYDVFKIFLVGFYLSQEIPKNEIKTVGFTQISSTTY